MEKHQMSITMEKYDSANVQNDGFDNMDITYLSVSCNDI